MWECSSIHPWLLAFYSHQASNTSLAGVGGLKVAAAHGKRKSKVMRNVSRGVRPQAWRALVLGWCRSCFVHALSLTEEESGCLPPGSEL